MSAGGCGTGEAAGVARAETRPESVDKSEEVADPKEASERTGLGPACGITGSTGTGAGTGAEWERSPSPNPLAGGPVAKRRAGGPCKPPHPTRPTLQRACTPPSTPLLLCSGPAQAQVIPQRRWPALHLPRKRFCRCYKSTQGMYKQTWVCGEDPLTEALLACW